jgi:hypothetical protein
VFSVAENISIKNNKLCKTNPISEKPKMNLTHSTTNDYENISGLLKPGKQTQSNPILSASGGLVRLWRIQRAHLLRAISPAINSLHLPLPQNIIGS